MTTSRFVQPAGAQQGFVDVRQRQYAIGLRGGPYSRLTTENIWTCMGFLGIDHRSGVVFLCHMDGPWCMNALPELVTELKKYAGDLSGFRLYTVAGMHPFVGWSMLLATPMLVALGGWMPGIMAMGLGVAFSMTRLAFWLKLRRLTDLCSRPVALWPSKGGRVFGMTGVFVDADSCEIPNPEAYVRPRQYERYKEPDAWRFRMTKAHGSA